MAEEQTIRRLMELCADAGINSDTATVMAVSLYEEAEMQEMIHWMEQNSPTAKEALKKSREIAHR